MWINVRIISYTLNMKLYLYTCTTAMIFCDITSLHVNCSSYIPSCSHTFIERGTLLYQQFENVTDINLEWVMKMNKYTYIGVWVSYSQLLWNAKNRGNSSTCNSILGISIPMLNVCKRKLSGFSPKLCCATYIFTFIKYWNSSFNLLLRSVSVSYNKNISMCSVCSKDGSQST